MEHMAVTQGATGFQQCRDYMYSTYGHNGTERFFRHPPKAQTNRYARGIFSSARIQRMVRISTEAREPNEDDDLSQFLDALHSGHRA